MPLHLFERIAVDDAEFDCAEGRERELTETIGTGVFQAGFEALKRQFGGG